MHGPHWEKQGTVARFKRRRSRKAARCAKFSPVSPDEIGRKRLMETGKTAHAKGFELIARKAAAAQAATTKFSLRPASDPSGRYVFRWLPLIAPAAGRSCAELVAAEWFGVSVFEWTNNRASTAKYRSNTPSKILLPKPRQQVWAQVGLGCWLPHSRACGAGASIGAPFFFSPGSTSRSCSIKRTPSCKILRTRRHRR